MTVALGSVAVAGGLVAGSGADDRPAAVRAPTGVAPEDVYSVFAEPPGAIPAAVRARAEGSVPKVVVPDPAFTRLLAADSGARLYAVIGSGAVCQWEEGPLDADGRPRWAGGSCGWLADQRADPRPTVATTFLAHDRWRVGGLVPDGIDEIVVTFADGSRERLAVVGNAATAEFARKPARLDWIGSDGTPASTEAWSDG